MRTFASQAQLQELVARPYHLSEGGYSRFEQVPAIDLGDLSLRGLVEAVDAEFPAGIPPINIVDDGNGPRGVFFLHETHEPLSGDIRTQVDLFIEALMPIEAIVAESFQHPRGKLGTSLGTIDFSYPSAHNWRANDPAHLDGDIGQFIVASGYPRNTEFVREGFAVPNKIGFKQMMALDELAGDVKTVLTPELWESLEEHAVAFSAMGTIHRKPNFTPDEESTIKSRALFRSTLRPQTNRV